MTSAIGTVSAPSSPISLRGGPGTATGYHALTFGFVLGELVRRATGRTLADTLREEIAAPLGVADELHFGVPDELLARVARQGPEGAAPPPPEPGSPLDRVIPPGVQPTATFANRHDVLRADIPSQGTMSARAVARMYAPLLGHVGGVELVSREHLASMAALAFSGIDQVMGFPTTLAHGYSPAPLGAAESRPGRHSDGAARMAAPRTPTSTPASRSP
jgi:CubicO group peptidase (beta-lactamase class C family)